MIAGRRVMQSGFTLIELLVALAVLVIVITVAVPGFRTLLDSNRFAADFNSILSGLNYARSEAVKRRSAISVEILDSEFGPWNLIVSDGASTLRTIEGRGGNVRTDPEEFSVEFSSLGRRASCSDPCELSVSLVNDETIMIEASGRVSRL